MWALGYFVCQNVYNNYLNNMQMFNISFLETATARIGSSKVSLFLVLMTLKKEQEPTFYDTSITLPTPNHVVVV